MTITSPAKWDRRFLDMAQLVSTWSKDPSTKVGAVLVRDDRTVISIGYNGFPRHMPDDESQYADRETKYSRILHAEVNAMINAREPIHGSTLYIWPFLPCDRCFVQLAQAGIWTVIAPRIDETHPAFHRWEPVFEHVRKYADEMGIQLYEVEL
jgi:dCMP deaminase